jgi:DNA-binding NarL/FixJ family response regulator
MSSTAGAVRAKTSWIPAAASVVGRDLQARRRAARLLADAGFAVTGEPGPGVLTVVVAQKRDDARLREIRALATGHPDTPLLAIVPAGAPNASLRRVLLAGASGIVLEDDVEHALAPTARAILAGQLTVPPVLVRQIAPRPLSHREKQALGLVVLGMTNREIASKLFLAESTVKTHLSSAFRKIDARSRSEAVARIQDPEDRYGESILAAVDGIGA